MNDQPLSVSLKCRGNEQCVFEGKDILLDINIFNNENSTVGFPLEYVSHKGPIIKVTDTRTKTETYIPTHIADWDLKEKFTPIKPGEWITMEWMIGSDELLQFGKEVDVTIEVTIMAEVMVNGRKVEFKGITSRRIIGK